MSIQAVVPFDINGDKFFTHSSWFSEKQHNAWLNIPKENHNLAFYYSLSTVSVLSILFRKNVLVGSLFTSYNKIITGLGGSVVGGYLAWYSLLKSKQSSEIARVVSKNECGATPLWKEQSKVVNLRERAYKIFMSRREGQKYKTEDVTQYRPDAVLLGGEGKNTVQTLV